MHGKDRTREDHPLRDKEFFAHIGIPGMTSGHQARVVQRMDNTVHRINHYPADSVVCFVNTNSDLSGG